MSKWNYFQELSVNVSDFPDTPQINFHFLSEGFSFLNKADRVVEYSFDGSTLHGNSDPTDNSVFLSFDDRVECKVWFRMGDDGYGSGLVRIEAWAS